MNNATFLFNSLNNSHFESLYHGMVISEIHKIPQPAITKNPAIERGFMVLYRFICLKRSGLFYDRVGFSDNYFQVLD